MSAFRKRPVVIEAVRFEKPFHRVKEFCRTIRWVKGQNGQIVWAHIPTLEGTMRAELGDWIIRGVQGEFYPCKPDIFDATYEPTEAAFDESWDRGYRQGVQDSAYAVRELRGALLDDSTVRGEES